MSFIKPVALTLLLFFIHHLHTISGDKQCYDPQGNLNDSYRNQFGQCLIFKKVDLENGPCIQLSRYVDKGQGVYHEKPSIYERRSVGIDDKMFSESETRGFRRNLTGRLDPAPSQTLPTGILVTDPDGNKHYLRGILHFKIEIPHINQNFPSESFENLIVQVSRRKTYNPNWPTRAAVGHFIHDFPGYKACKFNDKDPLTVQTPHPRQFVPCQGASSGENEYANNYVYNAEAPYDYGGSQQRTYSKEKYVNYSTSVHHLFWKYSENSCSRMDTDFYLDLYITLLDSSKDKFWGMYIGALAFEIGAAEPFSASDPYPPADLPGWKWDCDVDLQRPSAQLLFINKIYRTVNQTMDHGMMGSCKVDNLEPDDEPSIASRNNQFYGRCEAIGKRKYAGDKTDDVKSPSPNYFHDCEEKGNPVLDLYNWKRNAPVYGDQFGLTYDKSGIKVEMPKMCSCPNMPTKEQISALFPEIAAIEAKEEAERREQERLAELERKKREQERLELEKRKEEKKKQREEIRQTRYKKFSVRLDDEDDGYWKTVSKREGISLQKQRPRSPVAMVGRSVWRYRKLHGIFEVVVTFFLSPVCIFVSRYFKETWLGWRVLEQPAWLMAHLALSWLSLFVHIFGVHSAAVGISYIGTSLRPEAAVHRYIGFATLALFFLINLLGAFRPMNNFARRCCICLHWLFGIIAYVLNFACVITSLNIPASPSATDDISFPLDSVLRKHKPKQFRVEFIFVLSVVWIVIDIVFHVVANVLMCLSDKKEEVKRSYFPVLMPCVDEDEIVDTEGSFQRKILLLVYVSVSALVTIVAVGVIYSQLPYGRAFFATSLTHNADGDLYGDLLVENRREMVFPPFF